MTRPVTDTTRAALYANETDQVFITLITIDHENLSPPIRVCNDAVDLVSRGETFVAMPFEDEKPGDDDSGVAAGSITIQNVSLEITQAIRSISTRPSVLIEMVRAAAPDVVEMSFPDMEIREVTWNSLTVTAPVGVENFLDEPYPKDSFTPGLFPGVF
jgi:hypothetical protein